MRRGNAAKEFFIMRKLLFVLLLPILVLGVMGCGKIDPDVQTDYTIQGSWAGNTDDAELAPYILVINAATMVVKYYTDVSTPYRTEYSPSNTDRADVKNAEGTLTLFDYQTNEEIASINLKLSDEGKTLTIVDGETSWNIEEYYYSKAFPKEGKYTLQETDDGVTVPPPPPPTPVVLTATDFAWDAGAIKWTGTTTPAPVFSVSYAGDTGTTYGPSATAPTAVGDYIATITVVINDYFTATNPLTKTFSITYPSTSDMYDIAYDYDEAYFPVPASITLKTANIGSDGDITITSVTYKGAAVVQATWPGSRAVGDDVVITFNVGAPTINTNYAAATGLTLAFKINNPAP
jgi:hypothetical protein